MNKKSRKKSIVFIILSLLLIPIPFVMFWAVVNSNVYVTVLCMAVVEITALMYILREFIKKG